jgi:RNA polymerase sigma-70 factor (ECF subfamily)
MNLSSEEFITKLKNKDHESISYLVNEYHDILFKTALKQGLGMDQAEEVVQATWSTFFEKVQNFQGRSHIRTYIFGILYNKIKELWRSNKKYTHDYEDSAIEKFFQEDGNYLTNPVDPSDWTESNEFIHILHEELDKLPYNQKMAFILKEVEGETSENICKILDVSVTNLGVLIYRAKNIIRIKLEKRFSQESNG